MTKVTLQTYIVNKQLDGAVKFRLVPLLSITRVSYRTSSCPSCPSFARRLLLHEFHAGSKTRGDMSIYLSTNTTTSDLWAVLNEWYCKIQFNF